MKATTSIRISQKLYEQARQGSILEGRSISSQVAYWAMVGRAALDNPDLPTEFIAQSLQSLAEPRGDATEFIARSQAN